MNVYPVITSPRLYSDDALFVGYLVDGRDLPVALGRIYADDADDARQVLRVAAKERGIDYDRTLLFGPCSETAADKIIDEAQEIRRTLPDTLEPPIIPASEPGFRESLTEEDRRALDRLRREACPTMPHMVLSDSDLMELFSEAKRLTALHLAKGGSGRGWLSDTVPEYCKDAD